MVEKHYWVSPPELIRRVDEILGAGWYDPCPFPRPDGFDGLTIDWPDRSYINAPFGRGTMAWTRKAIAENAKGKTVLMLWPWRTHFAALVEAGAKVIPIGRPRFLAMEDMSVQPRPGPCALFLLEGKP